MPTRWGLVLSRYIWNSTFLLNIEFAFQWRIFNELRLSHCLVCWLLCDCLEAFDELDTICVWWNSEAVYAIRTSFLSVKLIIGRFNYWLISDFGKDTWPNNWLDLIKVMGNLNCIESSYIILYVIITQLYTKVAMTLT